MLETKKAVLVEKSINTSTTLKIEDKIQKDSEGKVITKKATAVIQFPKTLDDAILLIGKEKVEYFAFDRMSVRLSDLARQAVNALLAENPGATQQQLNDAAKLALIGYEGKLHSGRVKGAKALDKARKDRLAILSILETQLGTVYDKWSPAAQAKFNATYPKI